MTIQEAKAVIYGNVVYACEKAGFSPYTTKLVQDACDMIIAMADRKTENCSEKPNNCDDCIWSVCNYNKAFEDEPQTERIKTLDYCDICNHKGCDNCIANNLDDYCVPSGYAPTTQTETQNSNENSNVNLTFEKADEPQTENSTNSEKVQLKVQLTDEPQTERSRE